MAFEKVLDIPHQESGEDPVALGVRDANALLGNEEFITRYAQISAEAETCEVRAKREELERGRRLAVREVRLPIVEVRAMEYVQRDHAEIVTIDQARRVLKKQCCEKEDCVNKHPPDWRVFVNPSKARKVFET